MFTRDYNYMKFSCGLGIRLQSTDSIKFTRCQLDSKYAIFLSLDLSRAL